MPSRPRPPGLVLPCPDAVNEAIRDLMDEPASAQRSERYARLLAVWRELAEEDGCRAA
ncbi:hypothetical protein [Streptomyces collinus]